MPEEQLDPTDAGDDLAGAAVASLRSTAAVRASADAVELQAIATLALVRRTQAHARARREAEARRRAGRPGLPRPVDLDLVDRCTAQEVSVALWLSPVVARDRLELALELVERRPATFAALQQGRIDVVRARRITDAVRGLVGLPSRPAEDEPAQPALTDGDEPLRTADLASLVEAEALTPGRVARLADLRPGRAAGELTPAQLSARLARLVLRADPVGATRRTEAADARRGCSLRALPDGMALLSVTGRAELLSAAFARVDATARTLLRADARADAPSSHPGSRTAGPVADLDAARSLDQARVDVVLGTLLGHSDDLARADGVTVTVALVAPAGTVLAGGDEPGELVGYGAVPALLVRELAADASWLRWAADPSTGQVTGVGRRRYRPSAAVADLVRARDQRCRFPTCRRRATACDLDHVVPFPQGCTDADNLLDECRLHHLSKHRGGFSVRLDPDGTCTWTTPTGEQVVDHPPSWGRPPPGHGAGNSGGGPAPPDGPVPCEASEPDRLRGHVPDPPSPFDEGEPPPF